jgi:hypothetical protein
MLMRAFSRRARQALDLREAKFAHPMLQTDLTDRRRMERRKRVARCSHRTRHRDGLEQCGVLAQWRCTGCGRFGCPRHRIRLEDPELCNFCTAKIVHLVERGTGRRRE